MISPCNSQGCDMPITTFEMAITVIPRMMFEKTLTFFNTVLGNLSLALLLLNTLDALIVVVLDGSALSRLLALCIQVSISVTTPNYQPKVSIAIDTRKQPWASW